MVTDDSLVALVEAEGMRRHALISRVVLYPMRMHAMCSGADVLVTRNASGLFLTAPFNGTTVRVLNDTFAANAYRSAGQAASWVHSGCILSAS